MLADGTIVVTYEYDAWGNIIDHSFVRNHVDVYSMNVYTYRGYQYDKDTGFYYLQSRYYDPEVGRFLNADDTNYLGATGTTLGYNLYSYCENNGVNYSDYEGYAFPSLIGFGFQIELNIGSLTVGVEFIWFLSSNIHKDRSRLSPYAYFYGGYGYEGTLKNLASKIAKNPSLLLNPKGLISGSASLCIFAIWGYYSKFTSYRSYTGGFNYVSATIWNAKAYTAWSNTCTVVGAGYSTYGFSASTGYTVYWTGSMVTDFLSNLYQRIYNTAKNLKG